MKKLIYALRCPVTQEVHYIGKSTTGMRRPMEHMTNSHSDKIREWVADLAMLNHRPDIVILEELREYDDIDIKEQVWISRYVDKGAHLLNTHLVIPSTIRTDLPDLLEENSETDYKAIGAFIANRRRQLNITQQRFAEVSGVALTVVRKIEQGHTNLNLTSVLTMLSMFGYALTIKKIQK